MEKEENTLREQTTGEEIANTVTHVIGSHLGAAMLALLVWAGVNSGVDVVWKVTCASIFGASIILLYAISSAYHAVQHPPAKRVLKVLDHMASVRSRGDDLSFLLHPLACDVKVCSRSAGW